MKNSSSARTVWLVKRPEPIRETRGSSSPTHVIILATSDDREKFFATLGTAVSGYRVTAAHHGALNEVWDNDSFLAKTPKASYGLSRREKETLELVTQGLVKKEIAVRLGLSYHTVDNHLRHIYSKLQVNTRGAAVAKAINECLL